MSRAFIGLGSNLDDPERQVRKALGELDDLPETALLHYSSLYRSAPVGPQDQPQYVNAVAELETALPPKGLLRQLQSIESGHGRVRGGRRWGPRPLDLDILLYDDLKLDDPELMIPHPQMASRNFVLAPLLEIEPESGIPGLGRARVLLEKLGHDGLERLPDHG
jgi:2-amino-4-hydroxy-6-hydroxymethyldihydropteridine diphosphokinase